LKRLCRREVGKDGKKEKGPSHTRRCFTKAFQSTSARRNCAGRPSPSTSDVHHRFTDAAGLLLLLPCDGRREKTPLPALGRRRRRAGWGTTPPVPSPSMTVATFLLCPQVSTNSTAMGERLWATPVLFKRSLGSLGLASRPALRSQAQRSTEVVSLLFSALRRLHILASF